MLCNLAILSRKRRAPGFFWNLKKVSRDRYLLLSQCGKWPFLIQGLKLGSSAKSSPVNCSNPKKMRKILRRACYRVLEIYGASPVSSPGADRRPRSRSRRWCISSEKCVVKTSPFLLGICHPAAVYFIVAHTVFGKLSRSREYVARTKIAVTTIKRYTMNFIFFFFNALLVRPLTRKGPFFPGRRSRWTSRNRVKEYRAFQLSGFRFNHPNASLIRVRFTHQSIWIIGDAKRYHRGSSSQQFPGCLVVPLQ